MMWWSGDNGETGLDHVKGDVAVDEGDYENNIANRGQSRSKVEIEFSLIATPVKLSVLMCHTG